MNLLFIDSTWISTVLIVLAVSLLFYWILRVPTNCWEELDIPFIPIKPLVGSKSLFSKKESHEIDHDNYKKYGRMYGTYDGKTPVLVLGNPDLIKNVLVKDFPVFTGRRVARSGDTITENMLSVVSGETWKRIRCVVTPAFSTGKIKKMTDIIVNSAQTVVRNIAATDGKPVNGKELFSTFTMDVIASVAFATKLHSYQDPNNRFIQEAKKAFGGKATWRLILFFLFPGIVQFFGIHIFPPKVMKFFKDATMDIIEHRRKSGTSKNDFLQLLIDAEKESRQSNEENVEKTMDDKNAEELGHEENNAQFFKMSKTNKRLSEDEVIAQCVIFFLAAYDTTGSTIAFATYMLAQNPEIQDKLRDEVDAVIRNHDGKLTYEAIQEMKYLDKVVSETLRMFPPSFRVERVADVDYTFADTSVTIKKGTVVAVPVYAIHQDPVHYPQPEMFNPERFSPESKALRHPYSYLTFGAGPRNCVAMRFALMEVKLCIAYLVSQLRIKSCEETSTPLNILSGMGLLQPQNAIFSVEKREDRVFDGLSNKDNS